MWVKSKVQTCDDLHDGPLAVKGDARDALARYLPLFQWLKGKVVHDDETNTTGDHVFLTGKDAVTRTFSFMPREASLARPILAPSDDVPHAVTADVTGAAEFGNTELEFRLLLDVFWLPFFVVVPTRGLEFIAFYGHHLDIFGCRHKEFVFVLLIEGERADIGLLRLLERHLQSH